MRRLVALVWACIFCALTPTPAAASVGPVGPDLAALCAQADLIAVGQAIAVHGGGATTLVDNGTTYPARLTVVDLDVERLLKGTVRGRVVAFTFVVPTVPVVSVGGVGVPSGQFGIFFLRSGRGGYQVLDPYYPFIPAAPGAPKTSGNVLDQVTAELGYVVASPQASLEAKREALQALAGLRTPEPKAALKAAARGQRAEIRLTAIAALLARNDISELPAAEDFLLHPPPGVEHNLVGSLGGAIGYGVKNPSAIPALERLLRAKDVTVRRGAAAALRNTHDAAAIRGLAQALFDNDPEVQYQAVIGLAEITGAPSEWSPASGTFDKDPKRYLDHWRDWAKSMN